MSERPLRIVHLFRAPVGGLFRHVVDLATEQARDGHRVGIVCDSATGGAHEDAILAELRPRLDLGLVRIPMHRQVSPTDLAALRRVYAHLRRSDVEVIHGHGAKGGVLARMAGWRPGVHGPASRVYTPHGGSLHYDPGALNGRVYFSAERWLERATDGIIHVSEYEAGLYRAKVQAPRCLTRVIPNGLREDEFLPVSPSPDARDLLFLGAFRDLKGIDVLLHAMGELTRAGHTVSANLVGQPQGRDMYAALAAQLGVDVAFHDPMPARNAFATARAIVVPSRAESMPYVVLEAIAARVPIIATRVGGIPEIFGPHADELVPVGDASALAAAIRRLLADPEGAKAGAAARREQIQPQFNITTMHHRTMELYRAILASKST